MDPKPHAYYIAGPWQVGKTSVFMKTIAEALGNVPVWHIPYVSSGEQLVEQLCHRLKLNDCTYDGLRERLQKMAADGESCWWVIEIDVLYDTKCGDVLIMLIDNQHHIVLEFTEGQNKTLQDLIKSLCPDPEYPRRLPFFIGQREETPRVPDKESILRARKPERRRAVFRDPEEPLTVGPFADDIRDAFWKCEPNVNWDEDQHDLIRLANNHPHAISLLHDCIQFGQGSIREKLSQQKDRIYVELAQEFKRRYPNVSERDIALDIGPKTGLTILDPMNFSHPIEMLELNEPSHSDSILSVMSHSDTSAKSTPCGLAFLVEGGWIVTCTHIVREALTGKLDPGVQIIGRQVLLRPRDQKLTRKADVCWTRAEPGESTNSLHASAEVCILKFAQEDDRRLLRWTTPYTLKDARDKSTALANAYCSLGYPQDNIEPGKIPELVPVEGIQIVSYPSVGNGFEGLGGNISALTKGYSGAPLWQGCESLVVRGMICRYSTTTHQTTPLQVSLIPARLIREVITQIPSITDR
jgi:hypothetical protein